MLEILFQLLMKTVILTTILAFVLNEAAELVEELKKPKQEVPMPEYK